METIRKTVKEIVDNKEDCPLPLEIIPNYMGINLCSVDSISWQRQEDEQLVNLTIYFKPENKVNNSDKIKHCTCNPSRKVWKGSYRQCAVCDGFESVVERL